MVVPEFDTSHHMNTVGIMIWLTRSLCISGKEVTTERSFYVLDVILVIRRRRVYGSALIKIDSVGLKGFIETRIKINSSQKGMVMWDVLLLNIMRLG